MCEKVRLSAAEESRRRFLAGAGCVAAASLLGGCGSDIAIDQFSATLNHFLVTGQSLACGVSGGPPLSTVQPFDNMMLTAATTTSSNAPLNYNVVTRGKSGQGFRTLINGPAPNGGGKPVETISNGFADSLTARVRADETSLNDFVQLLSCSAISGYSYEQLAGPTDVPPHGSGSFQEMMSQVSLARTLATAGRFDYKIPAMLLIHGEADAGNLDYASDLVTWQNDMQRGVHALTHRDEVIPVIAAQTQAQPRSVGAKNTMPFLSEAGSLGTLAAAITHPGLICIACPEYVMAHGDIHMTADGYRHLGEMMAKAAYRIVVESKWWWPLMPLTTKRSGDTIVIQYEVPYGPLVIDTSVVSDPGNFGFNFLDEGRTKITGVAVTGDSEITISLSQRGEGGVLTYALVTPRATVTSEDQGYGPKAGPRGCVRDSDPLVSYYKDSVTGDPYPLQNYSIAWQAMV